MAYSLAIRKEMQWYVFSESLYRVYDLVLNLAAKDGVARIPLQRYILEVNGEYKGNLSGAVKEMHEAKLVEKLADGGLMPILPTFARPWKLPKRFSTQDELLRRQWFDWLEAGADMSSRPELWPSQLPLIKADKPFQQALQETEAERVGEQVFRSSLPQPRTGLDSYQVSRDGHPEDSGDALDQGHTYREVAREQNNEVVKSNPPGGSGVVRSGPDCPEEVLSVRTPGSHGKNSVLTVRTPDGGHSSEILAGKQPEKALKIGLFNLSRPPRTETMPAARSSYGKNSPLEASKKFQELRSFNTAKPSETSVPASSRKNPVHAEMLGRWKLPADWKSKPVDPVLKRKVWNALREGERKNWGGWWVNAIKKCPSLVEEALGDLRDRNPADPVGKPGAWMRDRLLAWAPELFPGDVESRKEWKRP